MKKKTLNNELLYSYYRDEEGLQIIANKPARGTERRHLTAGREPHSSAASQTISEPAKLLRSAIRGDAGALELLEKILGKMILAHASFKDWKIETDGVDLAKVSLDDYVSDNLWGTNARAAICRVKPPNYLKSWEPKVYYVQREIIRKWMSELIR